MLTKVGYKDATISITRLNHIITFVSHLTGFTAALNRGDYTPFNKNIKTYKIKTFGGTSQGTRVILRDAHNADKPALEGQRLESDPGWHTSREMMSVHRRGVF